MQVESRPRTTAKVKYVLDLSLPSKLPPWFPTARDYWRAQGLDDQTIAVRMNVHKASTRRDYSTHWRRFEKFCRETGKPSLPASTATVMQWLTHDVALTVQACNMQPYLSAINDAHVESKVGDPPALGDDMVRHVDAIGQRQTALATKPTRLQLPASVVLALGERAREQGARLLRAGAGLTPGFRAECELFRARCAVFTDYVHFNRGDTGVHLRNGDVVSVPHVGHVLRKGSLKAGRGSAASAVQQMPDTEVPLLRTLLTLWRRLQQHLGSERAVGSFWWLPSDGAASASLKWPQSRMNAWIKVALAADGVVAPDGFAFTYHSLRAGAGTAAHSIGVSERKLRAMGNWGPQSSAIDGYVDATYPASPAAYALFGWLLPRDVAAVPL